VPAGIGVPDAEGPGAGLGYLRALGVAPDAELAAPRDRAEELLERYRNDSVPLCSYDARKHGSSGLGGMTVALPASHARPEIVMRSCSTG
jgi:hypothetical protein